MKSITKSTVFVLFFSAYLISCGTLKKKRFLDYFSTYTYDTLSIYSSENAEIYTNPSTPFQVKGTPIDTSFMDVFSLDEAEDLRYVIFDKVETGPLAYYKIKLNLGYYFVIIRAGGEYWNSRYYGCLYHIGENKVTQTILMAENFGDAGDIFLCNSFLKKEDKVWNIYTHQYFQEPLNEHGVHTLNITNIDILYAIDMNNDRYFFKEISRNKNHK